MHTTWRVQASTMLPNQWNQEMYSQPGSQNIQQETYRLQSNPPIPDIHLAQKHPESKLPSCRFTLDGIDELPERKFSEKVPRDVQDKQMTCPRRLLKISQSDCWSPPGLVWHTKSTKPAQFSNYCPTSNKTFPIQQLLLDHFYGFRVLLDEFNQAAPTSFKSLQKTDFLISAQHKLRFWWVLVRPLNREAQGFLFNGRCTFIFKNAFRQTVAYKSKI